MTNSLISNLKQSITTSPPLTFFNKLAVRTKLIIFMTVIIVATSLANLYFYYRAYIAIDAYNEMLKEYSQINMLANRLIQGRDAFTRYTTTKDPADLRIYRTNRSDAIKLAQTIAAKSSSLDTYLLSGAIHNALDSYHREIDKTIALPYGSEAYFLQFSEAKAVSGYLENYIKQLLDAKLTEGEWNLQRLADRVELVRVVNLISLIAIAFFSLFFVLIISWSITKPIQRLTHFSTRVSQGDFAIEPIPIDSSEDINILALAFNRMVQNIQSMIREITKKSDLERKLHDEELKNLKIAEQLNEARFLALQSQINPHFLFNTLNTIMRTAMFEQAGKTSGLIESLADIFRYNLDAKNKEVFLRDELEIIRQYIAIQQARFGKRIQFDLQVPESLLQITIPRFTIQPLVENAIIHGIEPKEAGGMVRVKIYSHEQNVIIKVIDNGVGISKERIGQILTGFEGDTTQRGHTTGIGLSNVRERSMLYYKDEYCFRLRSKEGVGTVITIRLAWKPEEPPND